VALSEERIHRGRATPFPWERQALDIIYKHESLSDSDPQQAWELYELYDPSSGRLYEIDLLFLSRQGFFLVEIKSHPGRLTGDIVDWTFTDGDRRRTIECRYPGANPGKLVLAQARSVAALRMVPLVESVSVTVASIDTIVNRELT
jgi:hypothetical protein